jgi:hypothetical protein
MKIRIKALVRSNPFWSRIFVLRSGDWVFMAHTSFSHLLISGRAYQDNLQMELLIIAVVKVGFIVTFNSKTFFHGIQPVADHCMDILWSLQLTIFAAAAIETCGCCLAFFAL